jgi:hypothetical protein
MCRKSHGAAFATDGFVMREDFRQAFAESISFPAAEGKNGRSRVEAKRYKS